MTAGRCSLEHVVKAASSRAQSPALLPRRHDCSSSACFLQCMSVESSAVACAMGSPMERVCWATPRSHVPRDLRPLLRRENPLPPRTTPYKRRCYDHVSHSTNMRQACCAPAPCVSNSTRTVAPLGLWAHHQCSQKPPGALRTNSLSSRSKVSALPAKSHAARSSVASSGSAEAPSAAPAPNPAPG